MSLQCTIIGGVGTLIIVVDFRCQLRWRVLWRPWWCFFCVWATFEGISVDRNSMPVGYLEGPFDGIAVATQTIFMHSSLLRTFWAGQTLNECDISQSRQSSVVYLWETKRWASAIFHRVGSHLLFIIGKPSVERVCYVAELAVTYCLLLGNQTLNECVLSRLCLI